MAEEGVKIHFAVSRGEEDFLAIVPALRDVVGNTGRYRSRLPSHH
jgi:hypothetical protein